MGKGIFAKIHEEMSSINSLLRKRFMKKQEPIHILNKYQGLLALIAVLLSVGALWIVVSQSTAQYEDLNVSIASLSFDINSYNETILREAELKKQDHIREIESLILELHANSLFIKNSLENKTDYFKEESGEIIAGGLIVQSRLSTDNLTEVLKNSNISDSGLSGALWGIKFTTNHINDKILDARSWAFLPNVNNAKTQKEIFDGFENLDPSLKDAISRLEEYKRNI